tara:strand:+ start:101 stop:625 length:525 start_codon:yes stop_codon:yes gene_type:complete
MNQRVNIQYSIDMDDLDFELERLLVRTKDCLEQTNRDLSKLVKERKGQKLLNSETVEKISEIRENLARVDFTLADVTRIVGSYVSYQISQEQETEEEEQYQQPPSPPQAPEPNPYASDIYPPNFQSQSPEQLEAAANQLHETIRNGAIPLPPDIDPETLAEKLEQFKKTIKNAQ